MKIRTGFVSNSSSSSFCLMGINIDDREILNKYLETPLKEKTNTKREDYYDFHEEVVEYVQNICEKNNLVFAYTYDCEDVTIGINIHDMGKDETRQQLHDRAVEALKKVFPKAPKTFTKKVDIIDDYIAG